MKAPPLTVSVAGLAGSAIIDLQGGRVLSWKTTTGTELLFMPRQTESPDGDWSHGGISVCWPWFGKKGNTVKNRVLGCFMPVVFNAVIVGAVLTWGYQLQEFASPVKSYGFNALTVGIGEMGVLYLIGYPLLSYLPKLKDVREFIARFNQK